MNKEENDAYTKVAEGLNDLLDLKEIKDNELAMFTVYIFRNDGELYLDSPRMFIVEQGGDNVHHH